MTAVVALDCRVAPLDTCGTHIGRCRRKGKRKCGRSWIPLARVSSDTRPKVRIGWIPGQRTRPTRLESFLARGSLERKTYITFQEKSSATNGRSDGGVVQRPHDDVRSRMSSQHDADSAGPSTDGYC